MNAHGIAVTITILRFSLRPNTFQIPMPRGISSSQELELQKEKIPEHVTAIIMLVFVFLTTMYAVSTVDSQKAGRLVKSVKASHAAPHAKAVPQGGGR